MSKFMIDGSMEYNKHYSIRGLHNLLKIREDRISKLTKEFIDISYDWSVEKIASHNQTLFDEIKDVFKDIYDIQLCMKLSKEEENENN